MLFSDTSVKVCSFGLLGNNCHKNYQNKNQNYSLLLKLLTQNKKVLQESSKIYDSFLETKEKTQNEVLKLDLVLEQVRELRSSVRGGVSYSGDIDLSIIFGTFDDKIRDLEDSIKKSDEGIQEEKKLKASNSEKIKDIIEYMNKFVLEKRLYLDKVVEEDIIDQSKKKYIYLSL